MTFSIVDTAGNAPATPTGLSIVGNNIQYDQTTYVANSALAYAIKAVTAANMPVYKPISIT